MLNHRHETDISNNTTPTRNRSYDNNQLTLPCEKCSEGQNYPMIEHDEVDKGHKISPGRLTSTSDSGSEW